MNPSSHPYPAILILGAPGSGKGTQGHSLGSLPRFHHFSCGEVFRSLDTRTEIGRRFLEHSSRGELVPDDVTIQLWKSRIDQSVEAHQYKPDIDILVLDGIPRNVNQAAMLGEYIDVIQVFHLTCPNRDELKRRLQKRALKDNRLDDASETVITQRLQTYEEETKPILEYYPDERVSTIDATYPPVEVFHSLLSRVIDLPAWKEIANLKV